MGIGSRGIDPPRSTRCKNRRLGLYVDRLACLDANRDDANDCAIAVLDKIGGKPLIKEDGLVLNIVLIKGMQ